MFEEAGVTLALETYEQISTEDLVKLIDQNGSPNLGICLDPANVVARFENPKHCIDIAAPKVMNIHVKDFAFTRQEGWVGFNFTGAQMGTGSHDYKYLVDRVQPQKNGINEIVEHWLPWQGTIEQTVAIEKSWTNKTIEYLRSTK
jgi:sugar phosphate isomerase/epimerase